MCLDLSRRDLTRATAILQQSDLSGAGIEDAVIVELNLSRLSNRNLNNSHNNSVGPNEPPALLLHHAPIISNEQDLEEFCRAQIPQDSPLKANLRKISLMNNSLPNIPMILFDLGDTLEHVNLGRNEISGPFPASFPASCPRLVCLNVTGNRLDSFPENAAIFWTRMEKLYLGSSLQGNRLKVWPVQLWMWDSLVELDLSNNLLERIDSSIRIHLPNLVTLNLSRNRMTVFDPALYPDSMPRLKQLKLDGNLLTSIDCSIAVLSQLELLDLSNNRLCHIPQRITKCLVSTLILVNGNPCQESASALLPIPAGQLSSIQPVPSLFELASRKILMTMMKRHNNNNSISNSTCKAYGDICNNNNSVEDNNLLLPVSLENIFKGYSRHQVCDSCECPLLCEWFEGLRVNKEGGNVCIKVDYKTCSKKCRDNLSPKHASSTPGSLASSSSSEFCSKPVFQKLSLPCLVTPKRGFSTPRSHSPASSSSSESESSSSESSESSVESLVSFENLASSMEEEGEEGLRLPIYCLPVDIEERPAPCYWQETQITYHQ